MISDERADEWVAQWFDALDADDLVTVGAMIECLDALRVEVEKERAGAKHELRKRLGRIVG